MSATARVLGVGFVIGALVGLLGQTTAPFHVPGHELVLVFCLVACFTQLHLAAASWRWTPEGPERLEVALATALGGVVALAVGTHGITAAAGALQHGCDLRRTGLFLWLTWVPLGLLATVGGIALARWGRGWLPISLLFVVCVAGAVVHDVAQAYLGWGGVDPWVGALLALNQRADTTLPLVHVLQRGWLVAVALTAWTWLSWRHHRTRAGGWLAGWASAAVVAATVGWGSQLGIGVDGRAVTIALDQEATGPHVRVRYSGRGRARHRIDGVVREVEWQLQRLSEAWELPIDGVVVEVRLYDDDDHLEQVTGRRYASAWRHEVTIPLQDVYDSTLPHELVHALDGEIGGRLQRVLRNRCLVEGSAVAWADRMWEHTAGHEVVASGLENGEFPDLEVLLSLTGFWRVNEGLAYRTCGSFVGWLIWTEGLDPWRELVASEDPAEVYGRSVDTLEAEWRAWLATVPVDLETEARGRSWYAADRYPAAVAHQCPKLGLRVPDPADEAKTLAWADPGAALTVYRELASDEPDEERWAWGQITALGQLEQHEEVLQALDALPSAEGEDQELRRLDARVAPLAALGRVQPLRETLDARLALEGTLELEALRALLDDEELGPVLVRRMADRYDWARRGQLAAMLDQLAVTHPEHAALLLVLRQTWGGSPYVSATYRLDPKQVHSVEELLEDIEARPELCDTQDQIVGLGLAMLQHGRCGLGAEVARVVAQHCSDPDIVGDLDLLQHRLGWEREQQGTCTW